MYLVITFEQIYFHGTGMSLEGTSRLYFLINDHRYHHLAVERTSVMGELTQDPAFMSNVP
jgi:hypothetical protein